MILNVIGVYRVFHVEDIEKADGKNESWPGY